MGLPLYSPIVVSASTLSEDIQNICAMEDAGAGAIVLFSLFEEQIRMEQDQFDKVHQATSNMFVESDGYFPGIKDYHIGADKYLDHIRKAKTKVDIPIIASLNGISPDGWIDYAQQMQQAGADGIEINIFFIPNDFGQSSAAVEQIYIDIIKAVKAAVTIPIAVKMNPYFSAMAPMANRMSAAGADSLVLFNRFYQPDFNLDTLNIELSLAYSHPNEIRLPLLWIGNLYGRVPVSLAGTTGVHSATEVIKYILAGADVAMTASALYVQGIPYLRTMNQELRFWMEKNRFSSVRAMKGLLSQQKIADPTAYERANYIKILENAKN